MSRLMGWLGRVWQRASGCWIGRHRGLDSALLKRFKQDACEACGKVFDVRA